MHFARDPDGFACILQGILKDLHACCKGSLLICMHLARYPNGFACIPQRVFMALQAIPQKSIPMDSQGSLFKILLDTYGFLGIPRDSYASLLGLLRDSYGSLLEILMVPRDFQRFLGNPRFQGPEGPRTIRLAIGQRQLFFEFGGSREEVLRDPQAFQGIPMDLHAFFKGS